MNLRSTKKELFIIQLNYDYCKQLKWNVFKKFSKYYFLMALFESKRSNLWLLRLYFRIEPWKVLKPMKNKTSKGSLDQKKGVCFNRRLKSIVYFQVPMFLLNICLKDQISLHLNMMHYHYNFTWTSLLSFKSV